MQDLWNQFLCQIHSKNNLMNAYYFRAFMLDEWEVRSYMIISLSRRT